jgi:spermidine synthase
MLRIDRYSFVYLSFFLSGATALMYEIIWTRYFTLTFGSTTYSITTVLTAFMAGLALGSLILGRFADRIKQRLRLYGLLELLIGLYALAFPFIFGLASSSYLHIIEELGLNSDQKIFLRFGLSFLVMLVPTTLMGGTLPVLSRFFIKRISHVQSRIGMLYAINTFGAVAGTFLVGFYLLTEIGTTASLSLAAAINILVGIALILHPSNRRDESDAPVAAAAEAVHPPATREDRIIVVFAVAAFMISGFVALSYEVVWTRVLILIIGSSTYSFSIILVGFLVGIAFGSYLISHTRIFPAERINLMTFSWMQIAIGISAFSLIPLFSKLPFVMLKAFKLHPDSYNFITFYEFVLALLIMIIPTTLMGATLPVIAKIVSKRIGSLGTSIGNLYFFNTFGAIFGSFLTGFILIPHLGTLNTLKAGISTNIIVGVAGILLFACYHARKKTVVLALTVACVSLAGTWKSGWDVNLMDSGAAVYGRNMAKFASGYDSFKDGSRLLYYHEGINSTITVRKAENNIYLKIHGKTDASTGSEDMETQTFSGYLPVMLHPNPQEALVIGLGSGVTAGTVGQYDSIRSIDIVEIEPSVVEAASIFSSVNHNVLEDPRTRIFINDARNHLLESNKKYDFIVSEPSNPWISGIANLYTRDYLDIVRQRLNPGGILCQWIQCYNMSPESLKMVLKTAALSFENIQLWHIDYANLLIIESNEEIKISPSRIDQVVNFSNKTKEDFSTYLHVESPNEIRGRLWLDRPGMLAFSGQAQVNTDNFPYLEFLAPRDMYTDARRYIFDELSGLHKTKRPAALTEISDSHDQALIFYHLSKLYTKMEWFTWAKLYIEQALLLDRANGDYYFQLGEILLLEKRFKEAKEFIKKGLEIDTKSRGVYLLVRLLTETGKHSEALTLLSQNKDLIKDYEAEYGTILYDSKQYDQALPFLVDALKKKEAQEYLLLARIASCYKNTGRLDLAEQYYARSLLAEDMNPRSRRALAELYYQQGRYEESKKHYLFLAQYWKDKFWTSMRLANIYRKLNEPDKADRMLEKKETALERLKQHVP